MVESRHIEYIINIDGINPFQANVPFFLPSWKQKTAGFLMFSGVTEIEHSLRFRFLALDLGLDSWAEI